MTDWLTEIKTRADAATDGTWCTEYDGVTYTVTADVRLGFTGDFTSGPTICTMAHEQGWANADFIARARTDIPRLLDWIDQLQAEVDSLRAEKDQLRRTLITGAAA